MKTLCIVDTFGYFFRDFYAMPKLHSKGGQPTGVLTRFVQLVNQLYNDNSAYLVFALEGAGEKKRKQISPEYKANRQDADPELIEQIAVAIEWINKMQLSSISIDGYEADDAIASLNALVASQDICVRIVSSDKDLYQLINAHTYIYDPLKKKEIRENECFEKFGVYPKEFVDYQSLVGDSSDNVAGVKGIGPKSAQKLICHFHSLDNLYDNTHELEQILTSRLANRIVEEKDSAYKSKELVRLRDDLLYTFDIEKSAKPASNPLFLIRDELQNLNINILSKLESPPLFSTPSHDEHSINSISFSTQALLDYDELCAVIESIPKDSIVAFDTETDSLDTKSANIVGFSFAWKKDVGYYVPLNHTYIGAEKQISMPQARDVLKKLFAHHIVGHNLKFDIAVVWHNFELDILLYSDTMILAWLENSSQKLSLDYQAQKNFSYTTIAFDEVVPKNETFAHVNIELATKYAAEDSLVALHLYHALIARIDNSLLEIAKNIEFSFIKTLLNMEQNGVAIDKSALLELKNNIEQQLENVSKDIYCLAGATFNINSTQQLSEILFNKLGLKKGRTLKNKSYSTDEKTLENLQGAHAIIEPILLYRELSKMLGTYILPILKLSKNDRIYTSFLHTGTSTGRLSSRNPNLQNIPVRTQLGKQIRYCFVSPCGYKLVSVDYSQIELRLLAHFSKDPALLEAFNNDKDIHLETAIKLFGAQDAASKRNIAKSINFGLIYGMGVNKLSNTLHISQSQAKQYIESYFMNFPTVKNYLATQEENILRNGYALTLLGRRRIFDFNNVQQHERLAYLREGVNAIFQGSAADLIKLAMNKYARAFEKRNIKMLLQVHDELIFEVRDDEVESFVSEITHIMNNIYALNVPLKCGVSVSARWSDLK